MIVQNSGDRSGDSLQRLARCPSRASIFLIFIRSIGGVFSATLLELERSASQSQSIGNDGNGAVAHRRACEHGAQQPPEKMIENAGGNRDSTHVDKEFKSNILFRIALARADQFL